MSHRYIVVGAGAVGAALAAGLDDAGTDVVLVSRGATLEAIRRDGLRYTHDGRSRVLDVAVAGGPEEVGLRAGDVLVLATKSQDLAATLPTWAWTPLADGSGVGADLPVVLLQNGLDAERAALRYFPTVVGAVALIGARHVVAGEVEISNRPKIGQLIVGAYPSAAAAPHAVEVAARLAADLRAAQWLSQDVEQVQRWLAWKVLANVTFAVSVLDGTPEETADLSARVSAEARAVLAAAGHAFADPRAELTYDPAEAANQPSGPEPWRPSTWQSFARGSGSEVDFLNGEVALLARLHGVPAPLNAAIQQVLGGAAARHEGPGVHSVASVLALAGVGAPA
ncbi:2-dehydropantoate 2-reductase N-terminal domain-containing protein [Nocardioides zeae]|uniref:2-dehydropantoate 2-reductase N-terminal domain-containing protein n=1 Tax=Nocardioides imazamoxiresistens TaxID=3231893 RepID=A0ABU3Q0H9_9ACTN|nr:2-dehydropantoate 2-reductase N-terminal domain-containing protein [Nocardioides zeae]MDT9595012.1 2-dehydropantoate 2-reductase N-terminal domain-containing protein [Nocardioides zeae]